MNNFSLLAASRLTHLKVVAVALVFATLVVGIGFAARVTDGSGTANATVVKPGTAPFANSLRLSTSALCALSGALFFCGCTCRGRGQTRFIETRRE
jgi:hypothetical protein